MFNISNQACVAAGAGIHICEPQCERLQGLCAGEYTIPFYHSLLKWRSHYQALQMLMGRLCPIQVAADAILPQQAILTDGTTSFQ